MEIFISWSGQTGKKIAEHISRWLPNIIQSIKPFFSPDDLTVGARWNTDIAQKLESCHIGLIIVTIEALNSPWIMFEAGALSKHVGKAKVCPIVFGIEPIDVQGPLAQFQAVRFEEKEFKRILRMINSELGDLALKNNVLDSSFKLVWPKLEHDVTQEMKKATEREKKNERSEREMLEEILELTRVFTQYKTYEREEIRFVSPKLNVGNEGSLSLKEVLIRLEAGGNLVGANMMGIRLEECDLSNAMLKGANLVGADLTNAKLLYTDLTGANLERAKLDNANVLGANISYVNFWGASMDKIKNLASVSSMDYANFFEVTGLNNDEKKIIAEKNTINLGDYSKFFNFFYRDLRMTEEQINDTFLWRAHPYFVPVPLISHP